MNPAPDSRWNGGRQHGLTLISLMIGLAVGVLVLSATLQSYLMISQGARDTLREARLDQELRAALDVMRLDIRRAGHWADPDPDPLANPFQRRYARINNDLCVDTASDTGDCATPVCTVWHDAGECRAWVQTGSCLTYSYDADRDGRIGIRACAADAGESDCPRPSGAPFEAADDEPYAWRSWHSPDASGSVQRLEMEMQGLRLRQGGIDMRTGRWDAADLSFGCDSGRWESVTSPDIRITELTFSLKTTIVNMQPGKSPEAPCESGDRCRWVRSVGIAIGGRRVDDANSERRLVTRVAVRNDRLIRTP